MTLRPLRTLVAALAAAIFAAGTAFAQEKHELKLAYFVGDHEFYSQWLIKWCEGLEKQSGGRLSFKRFPGAQMGPAPQHYDMARTGQADLSWFQHGGTPGRFPITELSNLPYLIPSAEVGIKVLNDRELRTKFLDAEHRGVKILMLFVHQPGQIHSAKKAIAKLDDLKGMRIRFASPAIRDFLSALGATPVGVPPTEIAEQLSKGTIDGTMIDYGGAGVAFKLGGIVKYTTEVYNFVTSFGLAMNLDAYNKLSPDLKRMIDESVVGHDQAVGQLWDARDPPGKKALLDGGMQVVKFSPEDDARVRKIAADLHEKTIKDLEAKNLPARAVYTMMRELSERHAKTSKNSWTQ
jgi:TRAP-type transport system periplasmic protein